MGESVIPQKYREMMMSIAEVASKCPYFQTYHKEVCKMIGATDEELNELAVIIGMTPFWSNVLHALNYDYNKFVQELQQMDEHVSKKKINNYN